MQTRWLFGKRLCVLKQYLPNLSQILVYEISRQWCPLALHDPILQQYAENKWKPYILQEYETHQAKFGLHRCKPKHTQTMEIFANTNTSNWRRWSTIWIMEKCCTVQMDGWMDEWTNLQYYNYSNPLVS